MLGSYANNANFYLGGYSSTRARPARPTRSTPYAGHQDRDPGDQPGRAGRLPCAGFTGTGTNAGNCCTTIDPAAVAAAASYDYVIVVRRHGPTASAGTTGTEDRDRTAIDAAGPAGPADQPGRRGEPEHDRLHGDDRPAGRHARSSRRTSAILWSSYNGMRKGEALADVLLGALQPERPHDRRPGTRTTRPDPERSRTTRSAPSGPNGRTYMYFNGPVSYPFGYGLSYTTFAFSNLHDLEPHADRRRHDRRRASTSRTRARATATRSSQLYANTPNADPSLERPIKRLEGFQKVFLAAGQTKTVTLPIKIADLAFCERRRPALRGRPGRVRHPDRDVERRRRHPGAGHDQRQRRADAEAERPHREAADRGDRRRARHLAARAVPRGRRRSTRA